MKESKLTELIRGLSQTEFRKFGEFINSPFHNKSQMITAFYHLITRNYDNLDSNTISVKNVALRLFEGEENSDQNARTLISNFTRIIERFIVYEELDKYPVKLKIFLLQSLMSRGLSKNYEVVSKEINEELEQEFNKEIEYYSNLFSLKSRQIDYQWNDLDLNLDKSYKEIMEVADYSFIVSKLKTLNSFLSRKFEIHPNTELNFWGVNEIIQFIETNISKIHEEHPLIFSEYKILMMKLRPKEERHFRDLEKHVYKNIRKYSTSEIENVYYSLTNYCVNNIAAGEYRFSKDLFNIHNVFEKNGFYAEKKDIHYSDFLSVIISSLGIKEPGFAEYFHEKYKSNIAIEFKRDAVSLSSALILFSKGKYNEALISLNKVAYKYAYFYLKSKETLIKIYYEQK